MTEPTIRKAIPEDVPQIVACIDAAYEIYSRSIADLPPVSAGLDEDIITNQVWVLDLNGSTIGVLVLVVGDGFMKLANLAVHPDHGGKGLGRALIEHGEREALQQGFSEMRLNTHADMTATQRLYQRLGWIETGRKGATVMMNKVLT
ncbi:MAG: GNAT family N-acetyltransferase [Rhizobiaceae bacterium]|nr:GNAT family N-acetyltransferase [Rhizobiaceae bacterium]